MNQRKILKKRDVIKGINYLKETRLTAEESYMKEFIKSQLNISEYEFQRMSARKIYKLLNEQSLENLFN